MAWDDAAWDWLVALTISTVAVAAFIGTIAAMAMGHRTAKRLAYRRNAHQQGLTEDTRRPHRPADALVELLEIVHTAGAWPRLASCGGGCVLLLVGCTELGLFSWGEFVTDLWNVPWPAVLVILGALVLLGAAAWRRGRPLTARRSDVGPSTAETRRERWTNPSSLTAVVTAFAAVAALIFTGQQAGATRDQLRIAEEGQLTERFSKAVEQLGTPGPTGIDLRLGGIFSLERIMTDSHPDQPAVIEILSAYIREHTPKPVRGVVTLPADIHAAFTVLGRRDFRHDGHRHVDLAGIDLSGADLTRINLSGDDLTRARLTRAKLSDANLTRAIMTGADLTSAALASAQLTDADLSGATLTAAYLVSANLAGASLIGAVLIETVLAYADLTRANLSGANLTRANLSSANLSRADLGVATLTGANLAHGNLTGANLRGAVGDPSTESLAGLCRRVLTC